MEGHLQQPRWRHSLWQALEQSGGLGIRQRQPREGHRGHGSSWSIISDAQWCFPAEEGLAGPMPSAQSARWVANSQWSKEIS